MTTGTTATTRQSVTIPSAHTTASATLVIVETADYVMVRSKTILHNYALDHMLHAHRISNIRVHTVAPAHTVHTKTYTHIFAHTCARTHIINFI